MTKKRVEKLAYTVEEACDSTGFARTRIYRAIADGSLASFKHGRRRMVSDRALREFIAQMESTGQGARP